MIDSQAGVMLGIAFAIAGIVLVLSGLAVVAYQVILWLQSGYWTPFAIREMVSIFSGGLPIQSPAIPWQGIQKIFIWLLDLPLSAGAMVIGCATFFAGGSIANAGQDSR
jgi:hypothetical protein